MKVETLLVTTPKRRGEVESLLRHEPEIELVDCLGIDRFLGDGEATPKAALLVAELVEAIERVFERIERQMAEHNTAVILLAHSGRLAQWAFDVGATDYVLLPPDAERFELALQRACARIRSQDGAGEASPVAPTNGPHDGHHAVPCDRIVGGCGGHLFFVAPHDISWIEASGNYVELHTNDHVLRMRGTIGGVESRLETHPFVRVHRSAIVNLEHVEELHRRRTGTWEVKLDDGAVVPASRRHVHKLLEVVGANGLS